MSQAKIFTILEFVGEEDGNIVNHVHYVAAECSQEAQDIFSKVRRGVKAGTYHFCISDGAIRALEESGASARVRLFAGDCILRPLTEAQFARWLMVFTQGHVDDYGQKVEATYVAFNVPNSRDNAPE